MIVLLCMPWDELWSIFSKLRIFAGSSTTSSTRPVLLERCIEAKVSRCTSHAISANAYSQILMRFLIGLRKDTLVKEDNVCHQDTRLAGLASTIYIVYYVVACWKKRFFLPLQDGKSQSR